MNNKNNFYKRKKEKSGNSRNGYVKRMHGQTRKDGIKYD